MTATDVLRPEDSVELRKARGAFFTPDPICDFIARWSIRTSSDRVSEPSCGEAAFLLAAVRRFQELGADPRSLLLEGFEIHEASAQTATQMLADVGASGAIRTADFFSVNPTGNVDAVIGNPPFIRFQDFPAASKGLALEACMSQGVRLSNLASSWAAFVVHSAAFLKKGGRLGFVLPAELLTANYAAPVREYLLSRFGAVHLITFEEQVFRGVSTEAVLLLCEGEGPTDGIRVTQLRSPEQLGEVSLSQANFVPDRPGAKWTNALIGGAGTRQILDQMRSHGLLSRLGDWGTIALGAVTGNNSYFMLSPAEAASLGLARSELVRMAPPGSRHLRAIRFSGATWNQLGRDGAATLLFRPSGEPSKAAQRYIDEGERRDVQGAYKCRVRSPWWRVPLVKVPDLFLTCMNADTPRLASNEARVHHLNSVHGVYLAEPLRPLTRALSVASLNSATLLGAETVGRSYGGGVLKLEPREALDLPLPSADLVRLRADDLLSSTSALRRMLAKGQLLDAVAAVDSILFEGSTLVSFAELNSLRDSRAHLARRRSTRTTFSGEVD